MEGTVGGSIQPNDAVALVGRTRRAGDGYRRVHSMEKPSHEPLEAEGQEQHHDNHRVAAAGDLAPPLTLFFVRYHEIM